mmetsp:Transcript_357/g.578  ORF Transcript_357/g.578 Transcript_357/m.578 type:complete len:302 (+) Transcript_357:279-1184(+)|eukprot:CAMPEP_0184860794 /NCGR_PEP_ID=MMETSP0580-20130426/5605_1 /TAXON_ID=1118495 /ORGANISM="Dactyliosolen fragilissimus" /LENGTH=301 /DNA_ID=CAMNT_0027358019 /DNA_START=298 /DNA_END=1203 /DNA_ORIENTATION=-
MNPMKNLCFPLSSPKTNISYCIQSFIPEYSRLSFTTWDKPSQNWKGDSTTPSSCENEIKLETDRSFQFINDNYNNYNNITGTIPQGGHGIEVGHYAELRRVFTLNDIELYAKLIGDPNPIHTSPIDPHKTPSFDQQGLSSNVSATHHKSSSINTQNTHHRVVSHGMLTSSLFSSIFGTLVPGSIYRSQTLHFHSPVYSLDQIVASVHVKHVRVINRKMMIHDKETDLNNNNHASENHDKPSFLKGLIVKCDTQIIKILQSHDECTSNHKENNGINNKNNNLKCVSGVAEVWLPNILSHVID